MPIANLKVSGDKPGAVYLSKIFAGTQPLRKDTSKHNLGHGADLSTYVKQVIQLHPWPYRLDQGQALSPWTASS